MTCTHTVLAYERWYAYIGTWCVKAPSFALSNQPTLHLKRRSSRPQISSLRCGVLLHGGSNRAPGEHCQNEMSWTWLDHARSEFTWKILAYVCVCVDACCVVKRVLKCVASMQLTFQFASVCVGSCRERMKWSGNWWWRDCPHRWSSEQAGLVPCHNSIGFIWIMRRYKLNLVRSKPQ